MKAPSNPALPKALCLGFVLMLSCGSTSTTEEEKIAQVEQAVKAPLASAYCTIKVDGVGDVDTEQDYLPNVVLCENGGAKLQALKAQAISARSVAYYAMATSGSICNSQSCQVYSCNKTPSAIHHQAVNETSGMYLSYDEMLTYGFYVAGDNNTAPPSCVGSSGTTEKWVTYNEGKTGADVTQTELGWVSYPIFGQNRGCMSQWGARCLENNNGYDYLGILRFYYGADIQILTAPGSCVVPVASELDASLVDSGSDGEPTQEGTFRVCAGSNFHFWFELENTGSAAWLDINGATAGSAVRLGVPGDGTDPLTHGNRISLTENANDDVRSEGGDCNNAPGCRRTRFIDGQGVAATAPSTPGVVTTTWQLVDEGRSWFGPQMSMTFEVVDCGSGTGGSGGAGGTSGTGGLAGEAGAAGEAGDAGDAGSAGAGGPGSTPYSYSADEPDGCACVMVGKKTNPGTYLLFLVVVTIPWLRRLRKGSAG